MTRTGQVSAALPDGGRSDGTKLDRLQDIQRFLRYYQPALESTSARLGLFTLPGCQTFASRDIAELAGRAARLSGTRNDVYIHVHLHDLPEGGSLHRGSIASVRAAAGVFSDIDAVGPKRRKPAATLCPRVEDAIWVAEQFNIEYSPLRISLLIVSGYGCYPAVLFREPLLIEKEEDGRRLESVGRRFHEALHRIAAGRGWTGAVDYCDPAKVLRLPGCMNWKDANNPKPVRLVREDPSRFDPSDLEEILPQLEPRGKSAISVLGADSPAGIGVALAPDAEIPGALLTALAAEHPLFGPTWNHQRDDLKDPSCSGYDMALAGIAVACGLPDQQIANLIVANRRRFDGPKQARKGEAYRKYLQRTIVKAREAGPSSEEAEQQWAEVRQQVKSSAGDAPLQQSCTDESATPATRQQGSPDLRSPLEFLLAKVRATGDIRVVYENVATIASLPEAQVAVAYQDLKSALGAKLNYNHFNKAVKDARARQRRKTSEQQPEDVRPIIRTDDRLLDEIAAEAIAALQLANRPPVLFRRGGHLVMIHPDEDGRPVIMQATEAMMRGRLARVARFFREAKDGLKRVSPPEDLTRDVLASNEGQFPALGVLTQIPILRPDGTIRLEPGYDPTTRAYYVPMPAFRLAPIPENPGAADLEAATRALSEVVEDFPFESAADRANCIALLLTPVLRVAFRMNAPLTLIDAPKWGTGKTLLGLVVYTMITGSGGTVCAAPTTEEEWRKRMTSILERGSAVVIIDNIDQTLRSPALSAVLTTSYWEDRVLGRSEDVRLPNVSTWIATGNNVVLGGEMARRAVRIRLDAKVANPAKRTGFKRADQELLDWVRQNRGELVAALFTIVRAWWAAGQPAGDVPAFGSFSNWAHKAGGILQCAGIEGFLKNLDSVQQEADEESAQWDQFLRALAITFKDSEFTVADIADRVVHERGVLSFAFPDEIGHPDERMEGGTSSLVRRVGRALARKCGTRFGELELRIERGRPDAHTKVQRWRVAGNLSSLFTQKGDCGVVDER